MDWRSLFKLPRWLSRHPEPSTTTVEIPNPFYDPSAPDVPLQEPGLTLFRAWEELKLKQYANSGTWGLGKTDRWDADFDEGVIRFSNTDGFTVTGALQVIGTYDTLDGTWLWGWDHPSVDAPLAEAANLAHDFGENHDLSQYTTRLVECSEDEAWRFTATALYLSKGAGSYRGPTGPNGSTYLYMTFGDVKIMRVR